MISREAELRQIEGAMPRLNAMPSGCAFHPRCPIVEERCKSSVPRIEAGHHAAACWKAAPEVTR